jgi:hypothetical protein
MPRSVFVPHNAIVRHLAGADSVLKERAFFEFSLRERAEEGVISSEDVSRNRATAN